MPSAPPIGYGPAGTPVPEAWTPRDYGAGGPKRRRRAPAPARPWWEDEAQAQDVASGLLAKLATVESTGALRAGPGTVPWSLMPEAFRSQVGEAVPGKDGKPGNPLGWTDLKGLEPRERELLDLLVRKGLQEQQERQRAAEAQMVAGGPAGMAGQMP